MAEKQTNFFLSFVLVQHCFTFLDILNEVIYELMYCKDNLLIKYRY